MTRVGVVGAGGAGLASARALLARGLDVRVLEAADGIGGLWRYGETPCYASLSSNTSRWRTSFREMPMPRRGRPFVGHEEFLGYLEAYADRFGLRSVIETGARVERAERMQEGWAVHVAGRAEPERFDALVAATGHLAHPRRPDVPGPFAGRQLHGAEYRSPGDFAAQDVVVVGMGASAGEFAGELAGHARSVTLAVRSGAHVTPKHVLPGVPLDLLETRSGARLLPFAVRRRMVRTLMTLTAGPPGAHGLPAPDHRLFDRPITISDTFVRALRRRALTIAPPVVRLDGDAVVHTDGTRRRADAIIWATGYDIGYPWLPGALVGDLTKEHAPLLHGVLHPAEPSLAFVGLVVGAGALLPVFEAQARYAAAVLAGVVPVPDDATALVLLARQARDTERDFGFRHSTWRDRLRYVDALHREVDAAERRSARVPAAV